MKHNRSLGAPAAALLVIAIGMLLAPAAWAAGNYKTLHRFTGGNNDGATPEAGLIFDQAGNLYGTTVDSGGVFKLTTNRDGSWTESILYSFCSLMYCFDGQAPTASLVFDQAGNLYGTTMVGGTGDCNSSYGGCGVVFKLTPQRDGSWTESVLHNFCRTDCRDGAFPKAGLVFDGAGNLYGTTWAGGAKGGGTVFKLAANADGAWTESVLYSFCSRTNCVDGGQPDAGVIFDQSGNLYSTTPAGGAYNFGTVFRLAANADGSWTEKVLHDFGPRGAEPVGGVIFDQIGNLYGTTFEGGVAAGYGVVFELSPGQNGSWTERILHSFTGPARGGDGVGPVAGVVFDTAGNLYGTTVQGGASGCQCGIVFKLAPNGKGGWHEAVLHRFLDHPGEFPVAGVIFDSAGNLYGTTAGQLNGGGGSVFEITP